MGKDGKRCAKISLSTKDIPQSHFGLVPSAALNPADSEPYTLHSFPSIHSPRSPTPSPPKAPPSLPESAHVKRRHPFTAPSSSCSDSLRLKEKEKAGKKRGNREWRGAHVFGGHTCSPYPTLSALPCLVVPRPASAPLRSLFWPAPMIAARGRCQRGRARAWGPEGVKRGPPAREPQGLHKYGHVALCYSDGQREVDDGSSPSPSLQ